MVVLSHEYDLIDWKLVHYQGVLVCFLQSEWMMNDEVHLCVNISCFTWFRASWKRISMSEHCSTTLRATLFNRLNSLSRVLRSFCSLSSSTLLAWVLTAARCLMSAFFHSNSATMLTRVCSSVNTFSLSSEIVARWAVSLDMVSFEVSWLISCRVNEIVGLLSMSAASEESFIVDCFFQVSSKF